MRSFLGCPPLDVLRCLGKISLLRNSSFASTRTISFALGHTNVLCNHFRYFSICLAAGIYALQRQTYIYAGFSSLYHLLHAIY